MKGKKTLVVLLALVFVVGLSLTACDKAEPAASSSPSVAATGTVAPTATVAATEAPKDPIEFSIFSRNTGQAPASTNKIEKKIKELTGVSLKYEFLVGELAQKVGVMIAGSDYPDLVFVGGDAPQLLNAGAAIDVTDYIKNAPNLNALYNEHNPLWGKRNIFKDGKIYVLEVYGTHFGPPTQKTHNHNAFWLQKAVLEDAGYPPVPKTLEDYFGLIKSYYAKNPKIDGVDTIPYAFNLTRGYGSEVQNWLGYPTDGFGMLWDQADTTKYEGLAFYTDYNKEYLKKMNGFFRDGLIAKDSFTFTADQYFSNIANGSTLATYVAHWYIGTPVNSLKSEGKHNRTYIPCALLQSPDRQDNYFDPRDVTGNNGTFISVKCKDPQRAIDFMDFIVTEDIQKLLTWGIEGDDYLVDADGMYYRSDEMDTNWRNNDWLRDNTGSTMKNLLPKIEGWYSDGNSSAWQDQPTIWKKTLNEYDKKFLEAYKVEDFHAGFLRTTDILRAAYYPSWGSIVLPEDSPERVANQKLSDLQKEWVPQVVMAKDDATFESLYTKYWDAMTAADPQVVIKYLDKAVQDVQKKLVG